MSTAPQLRRAFAELTLRLVQPDLQFVARLLDRGAQRGVKLQHGEVSVDHIERFSRSIQSHSGRKRIAPRPRDVEQGQPDLGVGQEELCPRAIQLAERDAGTASVAPQSSLRSENSELTI